MERYVAIFSAGFCGTEWAELLDEGLSKAEALELARRVV